MNNPYSNPYVCLQLSRTTVVTVVTEPTPPNSRVDITMIPTNPNRSMGRDMGHIPSSKVTLMEIKIDQLMTVALVLELLVALAASWSAALDDSIHIQTIFWNNCQPLVLNLDSLPQSLAGVKSG